MEEFVIAHSLAELYIQLTFNAKLTMDNLLKAEREARARTVRFIRGTAIALSVLMLVISGHVWNTEKVIAPTVYMYDFMLLMMTVFAVAVAMDDASERRKNITTLLFIVVAGIMTSIVLS